VNDFIAERVELKAEILHMLIDDVRTLQHAEPALWRELKQSLTVSKWSMRDKLAKAEKNIPQ
jgi:hypothetical protein